MSEKALKFELVSYFCRIGVLADWDTHVLKLDVLGFGMTTFLQISERLVVRLFGLLSGAYQAALYCDWLSRPNIANHNTELPGTCQKGDQMARL